MIVVVPILKKSVIIREEPRGAFFFDTETEDYILASPLEAFILSLFDGTRTLKDIATLLKKLKNAPEEREIEKYIYAFVRNRNAFIEFIKNPLKEGRLQVDPYHFLLKSDLLRRPIRLNAPLSVDLYVTRRCNLNCIYCFANSKYVCNLTEGNPYDEMDLDTINYLIDQIVDMNMKGVMLCGGEPTVRPDLPEIISRLTNHDIEVFLSTNACLVNDALASNLRNSGLKKIQTKLDAANPKTQDRLSRVRGSYEMIIRGIKTLKRYSFEVSTVAVVTSWNIKEIPEVIRICANLGVDEVYPRIFAPGIWALHGRGGAYLNPSPDSILELSEKIRELRGGYKDIMEISSLQILWKREENVVVSCPSLILGCTILENGLVTPCEMLANFSDEFIIGDIKKEPLIDIWNSEQAERWVLRKGFKFEEPCSSCDVFERCRGGCPWKSIVAYGKWLCDPHCIKAPKPTRIPFPEAPIDRSKLKS